MGTPIRRSDARSRRAGGLIAFLFVAASMVPAASAAGPITPAPTSLAAAGSGAAGSGAAGSGTSAAAGSGAFSAAGSGTSAANAASGSGSTASATESAPGGNPGIFGPPDPREPGAKAAAVSSGFREVTVFSGLTFPTNLAFAPDGRVFVAEKSGVIKVYPSITSTTPIVFADLSTEVHDYWDRGLLGITLDPNFLSGSPFVYALYTFNAPIGGTAPVWPATSCPDPPGGTTDGCVASARLTRLTANLTTNQMVAGSELVLINDWCQQFVSHSIGTVLFGPDGSLYAGAGNAANPFNIDYGQEGGTDGTVIPVNPCGDPPGSVGVADSSPTSEGGAFRSQTLRRAPGEPITLDGTVVRVNPTTGAGLPTNPLAGSSNTNAQRIVAYGLRNPFRFTIRPGTNELWIGDVGQDTWEEIDRVVNPTAPAPVPNFGWPCLENADHVSGYTGFDVCKNLYKDQAAPPSAPYYTYNHNAKVTPSESCPTGSSVISGLAFYTGNAYPAAYNGALFFGDHARGCIWVMFAGANGLPDPTNVAVFDDGAANPVDLKMGPDGNLYYVDFDTGTVRRIEYTSHAPTASLTADRTNGPLPLVVHFDGSGSSDPDQGDTITYSWDLNGDGTFGDSTSATPTMTYATKSTVTVSLRVTDNHGLSDTKTIVISAGNTAPVPVIDSPGAPLHWVVGDKINFSGHATDADDGTIPATSLSWVVIIDHCPSNCHTHLLTSVSGVASGQFVAPDHGYPSYLELQLTATDSGGLSSSTSIELDPTTAVLTFTSVPSGLQLIVNGDQEATPFTETVIVGTANTLQVPVPETLNGTGYSFVKWSDGLDANHTITAPASAAQWTATFQQSPVQYLSDLTWISATNGWGPVEKDMSNGEQAARDGHPISINHVVWPKGLGANATSDILYAVPSGCTTFLANVGVDDEARPKGSVDFRVITGGATAFDSGTLLGAGAAVPVSVDVTNEPTIELLIADGGDGNNSDHADWADAKFLCSSGSGDTTPPTITAIAPADWAGSVSVGVAPSATFSEALNAATVTATNVVLAPTAGGPNVAATLAYVSASFSATLTPNAPLAAGTSYTVTVKGGTGGVTDVAGNPLAATRTWAFTTATGPPPGTIYASSLNWTSMTNGWGPVEKDTSNGEQAAGDGHPITLNGIVYPRGLGAHANSEVDYAIPSGCTTFAAFVGIDAEAAPKGSIDYQVKLNGLGVLDTGIRTGTSATLPVSVPLGTAATIALIVTDGGDGNNSDHADWADAQFLCGADTTPPTVTGIAPTDGATGVVVGFDPTATFSEAIDPSTLTAATVFIAPTAGGGAVAAPVTWNAGTLTVKLAPAANLAALTSYRVTVKGGSSGVKDLAGNALVADRTWTFTTASSDSTPPTIKTIKPKSGATGVALSPPIAVTFSEALDLSTLSAATFWVEKTGTTTKIAATITWDGIAFVATLSTTVKLAKNTSYTITVKGGSGGVKDVAGNALAADRIWSFTTKS